MLVRLYIAGEPVPEIEAHFERRTRESVRNRIYGALRSAGLISMRVSQCAFTHAEDELLLKLQGEEHAYQSDPAILSKKESRLYKEGDS